MDPKPIGVAPDGKLVMHQPTLALCIPHTDWVPARVESMSRVIAALNEGAEHDTGSLISRTLTDRMPNYAWAAEMRRWFLRDTDADVLITIQDDVLLSPRFIPIVRAQLTALPDRTVLGLSAVHALGREFQRQGHRWYATQSWLVGWAYAMWRQDVVEFDAACAAWPKRTQRTNEDTLLNEWIIETGRQTWHPVPSPVDHDTSIESSYANDDHLHRRTTVTWHGYGPELEEPQFWTPPPKVPLIPNPEQHHCWWCLKNPGVLGSQTTGVWMCRVCIAQNAGTLMTDRRLK